MSKITHIELSDGARIDVTIGDGGCASITSEGLHVTESDVNSMEGMPDLELYDGYNAAMDGLESLILGLASAGIDVSTEAFKTGIQSAVEAINNNVNF
jgi:hypothetical protein